MPPPHARDSDGPGISLQYGGRRRRAETGISGLIAAGVEVAVGGAIYHGVPMVSIALGAEHSINAASAAEATLALPLRVDEIDADRIATTSMRALHDPELRTASDAVRRECEHLETIDGVVPLTETYTKTWKDSPDRYQ